MQGVRDDQAREAHGQSKLVEPRPGRLGRRPTSLGAARRPRLRTQAALALLLGLLVLVALLGATFAALSREQEATEQLQQARLMQVDNLRLVVGMVDQEVGLRGYASTGQPVFLDHYRTGQEQATRALARLEREAGGTGSGGAVAQVAAAALAWSSWAEGRRAAVEAAGGPLPDPAASRQGEALSDRFRQADDRLTGALDSLVGLALDRVGGSRAEARAAVLVGGSVVLACLVALAAILLVSTLRPLLELATTAERIAGGARDAVPHVGRPDEVGTLARALRHWQEAETLRRAVIDHAPIGIFSVGLDGRVLSANPELAMMLGYQREELVNLSFADFTDPRFVRLSWRLYNEVAAGERERFTLEKLYRRKDGSTFWAQLTVAGVQGGGHGATSFVAMVTDVSERTDRLTRTAEVRRDLLPRMVPMLPGYELAGRCRPAHDLGGDFFDWYLSAPGQLTLTLGDVAGHGMRAAMLVSGIRAALRSAAQLSDPAQAVRLASRAVAPDLEESGTYATLVHARLDQPSGELHVIDAGHGFAFLVLASGQVVRPPRRDFPLGLLPDDGLEETPLEMRPGDIFVAFSDGVLDLHPGIEHDAGRLARLLEGARGPAEVVERLVTEEAGGEPRDDVTAVALQRSAGASMRVSLVEDLPRGGD